MAPLSPDVPLEPLNAPENPDAPLAPFTPLKPEVPEIAPEPACWHSMLDPSYNVTLYGLYDPHCNVSVPAALVWMYPSM